MPRKIAAAGLLLIAVLILGTVYLNSVDRRSRMESESSLTYEATIPPMDVAAPSHTEVATFALG